MEQIQPFVSSMEIACEESVAPACAIVVFGASGDLTRRKLLGSLFSLRQKGLLSENFYLLGCGRTELTDDDFRKLGQESLIKDNPDIPTEALKSFISKLYYLSGDYGQAPFYETIKNKLATLDDCYSVDGCRIFYLAVPPTVFGAITEHLGHSGLSYPHADGSHPWARIVIEKPFGRDIASATELNHQLHRHFKEPQIYRIDHYLGKETVQNILVFRFANAIFEPIWNRNYIDNMQISIAETLGIEHRAGYYDQAGALRDMFQNHMLQLLALVAMEPPASFQADHIRDEKVKLLRSVRDFDLSRLDESIVRGQYDAGIIDNQKVCSYRREQGIGTDSKTETFVAAKLFIDNLRWKDVPFYLRTGKRLAKRVSQIAITFKKVPHSMFAMYGLDDMPPNVLVLKIQPDEGISLSFQAKRPGSKVCMSTLTMNFSYSEIFGANPPEAYARLLLDCMLGDQTLFTRGDDVAIAWKLLTPVLQTWEKQGNKPFEYTAGCESFPQVDQLLETDGREWFKL